MKITRKLIHYHKTLSEKEIAILDGEIYEYYCYEQIVNKYKKINFVRIEQNKTRKNGFYISRSGQLCYQSNGIDLGEFDIIGFDSNGAVHWYEITKQKVNINVVIDKISRKKELMKKLFGKYNLYLIVPETDEKLNGIANILNFPEPDYQKFRKPEFIINIKHDNFVDLNYLNQRINKYDFIQDLMNRSKCFFQNKNTDYNSYLFERLYDLNTVLTTSIKYYNVEKKLFDVITEVNNQFFKKEKLIEPKKASYKEIKLIRNALKLQEKQQKKQEKKKLQKKKIK